ncbi:MAG: hypothetical protein MI739_14335 [Bacteroidales bacterium]|nr:hypothetical protein [Bacteroidales bacterium]
MERIKLILGIVLIIILGISCDNDDDKVAPKFNLTSVGITNTNFSSTASGTKQENNSEVLKLMFNGQTFTAKTVTMSGVTENIDLDTTDNIFNFVRSYEIIETEGEEMLGSIIVTLDLLVNIANTPDLQEAYVNFDYNPANGSHEHFRVRLNVDSVQALFNLSTGNFAFMAERITGSFMQGEGENVTTTGETIEVSLTVTNGSTENMPSPPFHLESAGVTNTGIVTPSKNTKAEVLQLMFDGVTYNARLASFNDNQHETNIDINMTDNDSIFNFKRYYEINENEGENIVSSIIVTLDLLVNETNGSLIATYINFDYNPENGDHEHHRLRLNNSDVTANVNLTANTYSFTCNAAVGEFLQGEGENVTTTGETLEITLNVSREE